MFKFLGRKRCPEHGIPLGRGGNSNFCPACGQKLIELSFCPFRIYISTEKFWLIIALASIWGFLFVMDIPGCVTGCNENDRLEQIQKEENRALRAERFSELPRDWHTLYVAMKATDDSGRNELVLDFIESPREYINPELMEMFSDLMYRYYKGDVAQNLMQANLSALEREKIP